MSKFKVGDRVRAVSETNSWGHVKPGDVGIVKNMSGELYVVDFPNQYEWHGMEKCFELVEEGTMNTKDLYTHKHDGTIVCGDTAIKAAKRKRDGEQQYIIAYEFSGVSNTVVKHSDIPALIAALLDVYDGDVKDKEEEIPF